MKNSWDYALYVAIGAVNAWNDIMANRDSYPDSVIDMAEKETKKAILDAMREGYDVAYLFQEMAD